MSFDLLNPDCQNSILISDDFCLDKSFDIITRNFDYFSEKLYLNDKQQKRFTILKERFEKNKDDYRKLITFVNQFSSSLIDIQNIYNSNKDTWEAKDTPIEVSYPTLISIDTWGNFDEKTGRIIENTGQSLIMVKRIKDWVNSKYPVDKFYLYKNIVVRVYIKKNIPINFEFSSSYKEMCECQGGSQEVCCTRPCAHGGSQGCNKMPSGPSCGNMYSLCPGPRLVGRPCVVGSCRGWGSGFNEQNWRGKDLNINRKIISNSNDYFVGFSKLNFSLSTNTFRWERT